MSEEKRKPGYWAMIPSFVRYAPELPDKAKLLYGELHALASAGGFCRATNDYFAQLYGTTSRTVRRLLSLLAKKKYIVVEIIRDEETRQVLKRRIWVDKRGRDPDLPLMYKTARNRAGMTQEAATEALGISVESMQIVVPSSENFT